MRSRRLGRRGLRRASALTAAMAALGVALAGCGAGAAEPGGTYVIGVNDDLSGPTAFTGATVVEGFTTYMEYLNEEKGGVNGRKVELKILDNRADGATALANYRELAQRNKAIATVGYSSSAAWSAAGAASDTVKVVQASLAGVDKWVTEDHPYLFKLQQTQSVMAGAVTSFAADLLAGQGTSGGTKVAILAVDTASGPVYDAAQRAAAEAEGWEVVGTQYVKPGAADCSAQASALLAAGPTIFLTDLSSGGEDVVCFKALQSRGWTGPVVNGAYSGGDETMRALASPNWYGERTEASLSETDVPAVADMVSRAQKYADPSLVKNYFAVGYLAGMLYADALARCPGDCTPEAFRDALADSTRVDGQGLAGPGFGFTPGEQGRVAQPDGRFYAWDPAQQKAVAQGDWICTAPARCP